MDLKPTLIIVAVVALVAFAFGRYSVKLPPNVTTQEQSKTNEKNKTKTEKHIVTVIQKDCKTGAETTTITEDDKIRETEAKKTVDNLYQQVIQQARKFTNISVIGEVDTLNSMKPTYGLSVNHEIFGPITVGVMGTMNGMTGITIGVNF